MDPEGATEEKPQPLPPDLSVATQPHEPSLRPAPLTQPPMPTHHQLLLRGPVAAVLLPSSRRVAAPHLSRDQRFPDAIGEFAFPTRDLFLKNEAVTTLRRAGCIGWAATGKEERELGGLVSFLLGFAFALATVGPKASSSFSIRAGEFGVWRTFPPNHRRQSG